MCSRGSVRGTASTVESYCHLATTRWTDVTSAHPEEAPGHICGVARDSGEMRRRGYRSDDDSHAAASVDIPERARVRLKRVIAHSGNERSKTSVSASPRTRVKSSSPRKKVFKGLGDSLRIWR